MIVLQSEAIEIAESSNQYRHNRKTIRVSDEEVAVSNQWTPVSIRKFISKAQQLGFEIEPIQQ